MLPQNRRRPWLALTCLSLSLACTSITPAQPGADVGIPERLSFGYSEGGQTVYETTVRRVHLEEDGFRTTQSAHPNDDVTLIQEEERLLDPSKAWRLPPIVPNVTLDDVKAFLDSEWDPYIGGRADLGRDADDFVKELAVNGLPVDEYIALFNQCRLPMRDFASLLSTLRRYDSADTTVRPFLEDLRPFGLTLKQWLDGVTQAGHTSQSFMDALLARDESLGSFLQACVDRGGSLGNAIKAELGSLRSQQAGATPEPSGVTCREGYCYTRLLRTRPAPAHVIPTLNIVRATQTAPLDFDNHSRAGLRRIWIGLANHPLLAVSWTMSGYFSSAGAGHVGPVYSEEVGMPELLASLRHPTNPQSGIHLVTSVNKRRQGGVTKVLADIFHYIRIDTMAGTFYRWQIRDVVDPHVGFIDVQDPPPPWIELK